jgi:hypothetical protein
MDFAMCSILLSTAAALAGRAIEEADDNEFVMLEVGNPAGEVGDRRIASRGGPGSTRPFFVC